MASTCGATPLSHQRRFDSPFTCSLERMPRGMRATLSSLRMHRLRCRCTSNVCLPEGCRTVLRLLTCYDMGTCVTCVQTWNRAWRDLCASCRADSSVSQPSTRIHDSSAAAPKSALAFPCAQRTATHLRGEQRSLRRVTVIWILQ